MLRTGDAGKKMSERGREGEKDVVTRFREAFNEATRGESVENDNFAVGLQCALL